MCHSASVSQLNFVSKDKMYNMPASIQEVDCELVPVKFTHISQAYITATGAVISISLHHINALRTARDNIITMKISVTVSEWEVCVFLVAQMWPGSDWRIPMVSGQGMVTVSEWEVCVFLVAQMWPGSDWRIPMVSGQGLVIVSEWEVWVFLVAQVWPGSDWRIPMVSGQGMVTVIEWEVWVFLVALVWPGSDWRIPMVSDQGLVTVSE